MLRSVSKTISAICFGVSVAGLLSVPANAQASRQDCAFEVILKSSPPGTTVELAFRNASSENRRLYWLDAGGNRKFITDVAPGTELRQPTAAGASWVATDNADKCLHAATATDASETIDIGAVQTADVTEPAAPQSLVQAPLAQSRAITVEPGNVATEGAGTVESGEAFAAAVGEDDAAEVPQISPIEQFSLNGAYHIAPRVDANRMLNSAISGEVDIPPLRPQWDGGRWAFEAVAGTPFVRIKNTWKNTYLADASGAVRTDRIPSEATESHWTYEPVDGTSYIQFRNRETDKLLLVGRPLPVLADNLRPEQDNDSQWQMIPVNAGSAGVAAFAAVPRNEVYDSVSAGCREIGGYWTGSSCRRPSYAAVGPLTCPRGLTWAEDIGECVWEQVGRCPPWQQGPGGSCGTNLACRGGAVRSSGRGHPGCYCRPGAVAWGNYPNLSCVPSAARIAPLLVALTAGGTAVALFGKGHKRPPIGSVFGNKKFGNGKFGNNTPVNVKTTSLQTTKPVQTTTKPVGTTTSTSPVGSNTTTGVGVLSPNVNTGNSKQTTTTGTQTTSLTPSQKAVADFQKLPPEAKTTVINSCRNNTNSPGCAAINASVGLGSTGTGAANNNAKTTGTQINPTGNTATNPNAGLDKAVTQFNGMSQADKAKVLNACKGNTGPGCAAIIKASAGGTTTGTGTTVQGRTQANNQPNTTVNNANQANTKPVIDEKKPPVLEKKPDVKTTAIDKKPVVETKPVLIEKKPVIVEKKPVIVEKKPVVAVIKPVRPPPRVVERRPPPVKPVAVKPKPVKKPEENRRRP